MHPLIRAYLQLRELEAIRPRQWSPYFPMWFEMNEAAHAWYWELMEAQR